LYAVPCTVHYSVHKYGGTVAVTTVRAKRIN